MFNPNFDPKLDDPSYYYLDQYGCPMYTKEEVEDILSRMKEDEKEYEVMK